MRRYSHQIVNALTFYRILAAPILLLLIISHRPEVFKWLLAISFFTDAIDGYLARRYKVNSVLGARLDSIGDDLTVAVGVIGIIAFKPEFLHQQIFLFILMLVLFIFQTSLAFIKYGRMSSFHTYAAKVSAILQGLFLVLFFFFDKPLELMFYIAAGVTIIDLLEEIILVILLHEWRTDVKGLYWVMREPDSERK